MCCLNQYLLTHLALLEYSRLVGASTCTIGSALGARYITVIIRKFGLSMLAESNLRMGSYCFKCYDMKFARLQA